jgi:protocatechuate 3,4-dioxygenase beta subunit
MESNAEGEFWFKAIVPVPYPIPHDVSIALKGDSGSAVG